MPAGTLPVVMNVYRLYMNIMANGQNGESHEMDMGVLWSEELCLTSILCVSYRTLEEQL
jgi:hypothetical protein